MQRWNHHCDRLFALYSNDQLVVSKLKTGQVASGKNKNAMILLET